MKNILPYYFLTFFFFGITGNPLIFCQDKIVTVTSVDLNDESVSGIINNLPPKIDSSQVDPLIDTLLVNLNNAGYLSAGVDSITFKDSTMYLYLYTGPTYSLKDIYLNESNKLILQGSGINYNDLSDQVLTQQVYEKFRNHRSFERRWGRQWLSPQRRLDLRR